MTYLIYSVAEIVFIAVLTFILSKMTTSIICKKCNQNFGAIPKRTIVIVTFCIFTQMSFVNIFIYGKGLSFMCYLAGATFIYSLFKKEEYRCPNCKTINQLLK